MRSTIGALVGLALAATTLAACADQPAVRLSALPPPSPHGVPMAEPDRLPPPAPTARPPTAARLASRSSPGLFPLAQLEGWAQEDHAAALASFRSGCGPAADPALRALCARARALPTGYPATARRFFERNFRPERLSGEGVLTAYFAPAYDARSAPQGEFTAPVRPRPASLFVADLGALDPALAGRKVTGELEGGMLTPYPERRDIDADPPPEAPLAYMRAEDLFFLQIQGSGVLTFPDGRRLKVAYAGDNGRPFVAIAKPMVQEGLLSANGASGDAIRGWLASHRGAQADAVMQRNPRYVFFSLTADDGREPPGAAGVSLTPGRSIAIDPSRHAYGSLYWIDASAPILTGAFKSYRRLVMALDTGAAIKGEVRADLYLGRGEAAGREAGRVRHTLRLTRLVPLAQPLAEPLRGEGDEADAAP